MIALPSLPSVFTTRQIECVSCREQFVVSEAFMQPHHPEAEWRLSPGHHPDTELRYQEVRRHRSVTPQTRSEPNWESLWPYDEERRDDTYVNCPRCGADNRNWMQINNLPPSPTPWLDWLFGFRIQQFFWATLGPTIAFALAIVAFWASFDLDHVLGRTIPLTLFTFLAGYITTWAVTRQWRRLREFNNLRGLVIPRRVWARFSPVEITAVISLIVFVFLIPFLIYIFLPLSFGLVFSFFDPEEEPTLRQRVGDVIENLEVMAEAAPNDEAEELSQEAIASVREYREAAELLPVPRRNGTRPPLTVTRDFLQLWFGFVGLATIISALISMEVVRAFAARVNAQLPRPIYFSVANMTRVVAWEAKQALEIRGNMEHIQWMDVQRNDRGGINLVGLHRDLPEFDARGNPTGTKVRAQRYIIETNMWGRIESANVRDMRVAPAVGSPGFVVDKDLPQFVATPANSQR